LCREYLVENYQHYRVLNPKFGFLVRDNVGQPRATLIGEYAHGYEPVTLDITEMTHEQIEQALKSLNDIGAKINQQHIQYLPVGHPLIPVDILQLPEDRKKMYDEYVKEHTATFK
jgi:hypothetical protein